MKPLLLENSRRPAASAPAWRRPWPVCSQQRSGLTLCDFETVDIDTHIGEVAGVDAQRLPLQLRRFDCRNNRLAELALQQDGFFEAVKQRGGALGPGARRRVYRHQHRRHLQTELAYRERDSVSGALPPAFDTAPPTIRSPSRTTFGGAAASRGRPWRSPGLRVQRQGVRSAQTHDRSGTHRCGPGGRSGFAVPDHACMAFIRCSSPRRAPAARSMSRAMASPSVKRRPFCFSSARRKRRTAIPCCCSASANPAMPITCRRRIPKVSARDAPCRRRLPRRRSSPAISITSICTVPEPRATIARKARPSPACSVRPRLAARPRAPPAIHWEPPARSRQSSARSPSQMD